MILFLYTGHHRPPSEPPAKPRQNWLNWLKVFLLAALLGWVFYTPTLFGLALLAWFLSPLGGLVLGLFQGLSDRRRRRNDSPWFND